MKRDAVGVFTRSARYPFGAREAGVEGAVCPAEYVDELVERGQFIPRDGEPAEEPKKRRPSPPVDHT